ncbi:hypothetical protein KL86CLO1_10780 [uncultured Eubacteriales bacterium]|uniref:Uncharacterized protein n=1 Tax=uncultured Eubacteriales bacterium TaxID=172733 RepID=A0A212JAN9_9FIRM|nr:hypothetical protein KL86CLO1_10780 [uncultured Eubacteriales bacterium]
MGWVKKHRLQGKPLEAVFSLFWYILNQVSWPATDSGWHFESMFDYLFFFNSIKFKREITVTSILKRVITSNEEELHVHFMLQLPLQKPISTVAINAPKTPISASDRLIPNFASLDLKQIRSKARIIISIPIPTSVLAAQKHFIFMFTHC